MSEETKAATPTVEEALKELREMFPLNRVHIRQSTNHWSYEGQKVNHFQKGEWEAFCFIEGRDVGDFGRLERVGRGSTLADCMAKVRVWKESHV